MEAGYLVKILEELNKENFEPILKDKGSLIYIIKIHNKKINLLIGDDLVIDYENNKLGFKDIRMLISFLKTLREML